MKEIVHMSKNKYSHHGAKKAAVLRTNKSKMKPMAIGLAVVAVLIAVAVAFYAAQPNMQPTNAMISANAGASQISYPISMFNDGAAHHFEHKVDGLTIRYFILKSSDGAIRAAFDACDVCWPAGKGYFQDGDDMVCRNCGRRFASILVNEVKGGCNPAPLIRNVQGDQLVIRVEDILQGRSYFNFKKKA
jgi:uncharacterized membrane protein